jgi:hypothetical protein
MAKRRVSRKRIREDLLAMAGRPQTVTIVRGVRSEQEVHGVILSMGARLVMLRAFRDFVDDGFAVLPLTDIDEVEHSDEVERFTPAFCARKDCLTK